MKKLLAIVLTFIFSINTYTTDARYTTLTGHLTRLRANTFIDERTEKPAKNQSEGVWLIQAGLHLTIKLRQIKDQTRFQGEDWVSLSLDPFQHTRSQKFLHRKSTKYAHLATGRAEKSEWIGLWKTAAQIVEDRDEIPWRCSSRYNSTHFIGKSGQAKNPGGVGKTFGLMSYPHPENAI